MLFVSYLLGLSVRVACRPMCECDQRSLPQVPKAENNYKLYLKNVLQIMFIGRSLSLLLWSRDRGHSAEDRVAYVRRESRLSWISGRVRRIQWAY